MKQSMVGALLLLVGVLVLGRYSAACSVVDHGDEIEFEDAIRGQPTEVKLQMARATLQKRTNDYLKGKNPNELVVGVECRSSNDGGATWAPWTTQNVIGDYDALDMVHCMGIITMTYRLCLDAFVEGAAQEVQDFIDTVNADNDVLSECRSVVNPGYNHVEVPGADDALSSVSLSDIVKWLLGSPTMPSGFDPKVWEALGPFICAEGAGWGCPGDSKNPGLPVTITPAPSGGDPGGTP